MQNIPPEPRGYLHLICGEFIERDRFSDADISKLRERNDQVRCPECLLPSRPEAYRPVRLQPR